jgi:excisionase family DNA binding protein
MQALILDHMPSPLTTTEVAAMTAPPTTRFTVEREIRRGNLEAEKVGGRWLIEPDKAERWAKEFVRYRTQRHAP